ncbi:hypothetical protein L198_00909 [Cryptococcus wingfieldii CBS 7118]|uniref:Uncharacterized protein n=1 Tax=Cryptococcus wingfieldii CBS 7118 TaxID=1295528 RepID=A0A1E3K2F8_9TREE|nr:hypothetical protein L198_00909 [Cryptococcus wingfieldii CBS 7118]ODO07330.1 hypothetical protein L198_00909 [Cryptococcus wingfieldii CBS 7118]
MFNVCFIVKLTGINEIRVSHIIQRDTSQNANTYTNRTAGASLAILMAAMARLGPVDDNHSMKATFARVNVGANEQDQAASSAAYRRPPPALLDGQVGSSDPVLSTESVVGLGDRDTIRIFDEDLGLVPPTSHFKALSALRPANDIPLTLPPDFRLKQVLTKPYAHHTPPLTSTASSVSHIQTLQFGTFIGTGALWDVYELPDAPGHVAKFCSPYGTLFHRGYEHLDVGDIVKERETDTLHSQILAPSGHAPVTLGLWRGFWVDPAHVTYDKGGEAKGWLMYVSIQEDMRQDGEWESVDD